MSLISTEGQLLELNNAMKSIMGIPPDIRMPVLNFFSINVMKRAGIDNRLRECIRKKVNVDGEMSYKSTRRGQLVNLSYSFLPVLNHKGEVENVLGYVTDCTDQKKLELLSNERAEFLNLVINSIKSPFFVKDENHNWVMLNDAAVAMMGQSREALLGKSDYDLYSKEQADVFWKYDELVIDTGSSENEEQITWSDGSLHTIVTHKQLYVEKPSGRKFIVGTIHDVSAYQKLVEELRESEHKYHELFDNANDFIITIDLEGFITNANRTLLSYLEVSLEEITKLNIYTFVSNENMDFVLEMKDRLLKGKLDNSFEVDAKSLDGKPVVYEIKASLIKKQSEVVGYQCVFSDVTERREAHLSLEKYNTSLIELNRTKDKFFSIIAHDLRNPYSSMIGFSELLLEDFEKMPVDEIRNSLKIIRNSAKNSLNLLENLLAWSRLETGRMPFEPAKVVITDVIEEVVNVLFSVAYRKKIEITNTIDIDVLLWADKNMLNSIFNNLIMNAIKFTPIGGKVNVSAIPNQVLPGSHTAFVNILVTDTGIGIEAADCANLFSLSKPHSRTGTEKEEGTGLGLVLTREMVERHGGLITVESTPGVGSVFSVFIPAYQPDADAGQ